MRMLAALERKAHLQQAQRQCPRPQSSKANDRRRYEHRQSQRLIFAISFVVETMSFEGGTPAQCETTSFAGCMLPFKGCTWRFAAQERWGPGAESCSNERGGKEEREKKNPRRAGAYFLKDRKEKIPDFRRSCFSRTLSPISVFLLCT